LFKSLLQFKKAAAHELGHILGLDDAYGENMLNFKLSDYINGTPVEIIRPDATTILGSTFDGWMSNQNNVVEFIIRIVIM